MHNAVEICTIQKWGGMQLYEFTINHSEMMVSPSNGGFVFISKVSEKLKLVAITV